MSLPNPPFLQHLVLEAPWPLIALLAIVAVLLWWANRDRRQRALSVIAIVCLLLAPTVYVVASNVTTDRERLLARTESLVVLATPDRRGDLPDLDALRDLFHERAELTDPHGAPWLSVDRIIEQVRVTGQRIGVVEHRIKRLEAANTGRDVGQTLLEVRTASSQRSQPILTRWLLTWQRETSDAPWRISEVRWLEHPLGPSPTRRPWR